MTENIPETAAYRENTRTVGIIKVFMATPKRLLHFAGFFDGHDDGGCGQTYVDVEVEPVRANQCSSICAYKPSNLGDNSYSVNSGKSGDIIGRTFAILLQRSKPRSLAVVTKVRYRNSIDAVAC